MPLDPRIPHQDITSQIIKAAFRVHDKIGPGHKEAWYQRHFTAMMIEAGLSVEEEREFDMVVDGAWIGRIKLDQLVNEVVIVEVEAFPHLLTRAEVAQVIAYLAATGLKVGLLFNFGRSKLEFQRILPPRKLAGWEEKIKRYLK